MTLLLITIKSQRDKYSDKFWMNPNLPPFVPSFFSTPSFFLGSKKNNNIAVQKLLDVESSEFVCAIFPLLYNQQKLYLCTSNAE